ncbi:MAG: flagellar protein export ATPase FliI [Brevinemataceae bacterium]
MSDIFTKYQNAVDRTSIIKTYGKLESLNGLLIQSIGPIGSIGDLCLIHTESTPIKAEIVGFSNGKTLLMPLSHIQGASPGMKIENLRHPLRVHVGQELLGRVISGIGEPIDNKGPIQSFNVANVDNHPPDPYTRKRISQPISTGVRAIDGILTAGQGQRLGIFAGSGVGKSTLLGMIARNTNADINVIALIGERGREVREFLETELGEQGREHSIIIAVTGDEPPLMRIRGAYTATAIAEYFRDQGCNVMFMMDSVTRFAMAQREIGLSIGEPPAMRGYTPSVFSTLQKLLERTGSGVEGTITAFYTVLVEGDDDNEPISDTVRGILDGHILLSRDLADKNHFPAIDVTKSVSRVMKDIVSSQHLANAAKLKELVSVYNDSEDLINIGAYVRGANPKIDEALKRIPQINQFLKQFIDEQSDYDSTVSVLNEILK